MVNEALDTCIRLNQWDQACAMGADFKLGQLENIWNCKSVCKCRLKFYQSTQFYSDLDELTGTNEKTLAAAQLYRKAAMFIHAAKIVFEVIFLNLQHLIREF
jgi:hypothetical protein